VIFAKKENGLGTCFKSTHIIPHMIDFVLEQQGH